MACKGRGEGGLAATGGSAGVQQTGA